MNYFDTPALHCWWGDPVRWEIAVLSIAALSLFVIIRSACGRLQRFWSVIPLIAVVLPSVVGALFSLVQIHLIFHTLATSGWTGPVGPEEMIFCALYSTHIGIYCSIVLLVIWTTLFGFKRKKGEFNFDVQPKWKSAER